MWSGVLSMKNWMYLPRATSGDLGWSSWAVSGGLGWSRVVSVYLGRSRVIRRGGWPHPKQATDTSHGARNQTLITVAMRFSSSGVIQLCLTRKSMR